MQFMWERTHQKVFSHLDASRVWDVWTDINQWHTWRDDIEFAKLVGDFQVGNLIMLKPDFGPAVKIELIEVDANRQFIDLTRFPGAKMYGRHEIIERSDGLEIITSMSIAGPFAWLWQKLVAQGIANGIPQQTENLAHRVKHVTVQA